MRVSPPHLVRCSHLVMHGTGWRTAQGLWPSVSHPRKGRRSLAHVLAGKYWEKPSLEAPQHKYRYFNLIT